MNTSFDYAEYLKALNELIVSLQGCDPEVENFGAAYGSVSKVFKMLRISNAVTYVESFVGNTEGRRIVSKEHRLFADECVDHARSYEFRRAKGEVNRFLAVLNQYQGDPDWTEDELECIESVITILYTFIGNTRLSDRAYYLTFMDVELDIPNQVSIEKNIAEIIAANKAAEYSSCRFNIRKMATINATLGRPKANVVLRTYLKNIQHELGEDGQIFRIGGDNFFVIFKDYIYEKVASIIDKHVVRTEYRDVREVMFEVRAGFYRNWAAESTVGEVISLTHRIGMAAHLDNYRDFLYLDEATLRQYAYANQVIDNFPNAIKNHDFIVYYQPKFNSESDKIVGAEALCRWMHHGELIPPSRFIPILEQGIQICKLDFYMLSTVCFHIHNWLEQGNDAIPVSVNFSRMHLSNKNLARDILDVIDEYDIPHHLIEIELTETTTDVNYHDLANVVSQLNSYGIHTAVDDFGIGYSSLNLIRDLPWDVLKIDMSFLPVANDPKYDEKKTIIKHLVSMSGELGITCLAEGAETAEQVSLLKEYGCTLIQGYYYSKPLSQDEFEERLRLSL